MSLITIRICEEADAKLMMKDGSLLDFIQMWSDRFPQQTYSKLQEIKTLKNQYGFGLKEAKQIVDAMHRNDETVHFEIGDRIRIEKYATFLSVHKKGSDDNWSYYGGVQPDTLTRLLLFPEKPKTCPFRFKNYGEF